MPGYSTQLNDPLLGALSTASFTGPTDITTTTTRSALTLPANYLKEGMTLHVQGGGTFSTTATPTLVFGVYYGTTVQAVSVAFTTASGAVTLPWRWESWTTVRTVGSAGVTFTHGGVWLGSTVAAISNQPVPGIAQVTATTDTTAAGSFGLKATWSASSASNIVVLNSYTVELLNYNP